MKKNNNNNPKNRIVYNKYKLDGLSMKDSRLKLDD